MTVAEIDHTGTTWSRWFPEIAGYDAGRKAEFFQRVGGTPEPGPAVDLGEDLSPGAAPDPATRRSLDEAVGEPLQRFLAGLVAAELRDLRDVVAIAAPELARAGAPLADPEGFVTDQIGQVVLSLSDLGLRTVLAELHRHRRAGELRGDDPRERYADFVRTIARPAGRDDLLGRYPDLRPALARCVRRRSHYLGEVLAALAADAAELPSLLGAAPGRVHRVALGAGDPHRGGRSVCTVHTDAGPVLLKPRSLAVDTAFARFCDVVATGTGVRLRAPAVLERGSYGWAQHVAAELPAGDAQEDAYYTALGALTAVLYFLDATDMHAENLVATADGPVVVDLETLLHGRLRRAPSYDDGAPVRGAVEALYRSVCGTGVMPLVLARRAGASEEGFDVGASGFEAGALSPFRSFALEDRGTDRMRVTLARRPFFTDVKLPVFTTDRDGPPRQVARVVEGFRRVYHWVADHRDDLARTAGEVFAATESRFVHQPTLFYVQLLRMSANPEVRGVPGGTRILANRVGLRLPDAPPEVTRAEYDDLVDGDVPCFTTRADSRHVWDSRGRDLGPLLEAPPLEGVCRKLAAAGPDDLELQCGLIRMSYINKFRDVPERNHLERTPQRPLPAPRVRRREHLDTAVEVGEDLLRRRFTGRDPRFPSAWIGPLVSSTSSRLWRLGTLGYDLYGGLSGVGLFLAALGAVSGRERFSAAARDVLQPLADQVPDLLAHGLVSSTGAFGGLPGTLYALDRAGRLLGDGSLVEAAARHAPAVAGLVRDSGPDALTDLVTGSAGALACLLALHTGAVRDAGRPGGPAPVVARELLGAATGVGEQLIGARVTGPRFTGFAHGSAGVHPWLHRLHRLTGDPRFAVAADDLLAGEDEQFDVAAGNWAVEAGGSATSHAWCHGAAGILLSRLLRLRDGDDRRSVADGAAHALAAVRAGGLGHNLTCCHGDSGNLEVLGFASEVLDLPKLAHDVDRGRDRLWDGVLRTALADPQDKYAMTQSLLVGLPGAGYSLLRSLEPHAVPAFLWLD